MPGAFWRWPDTSSGPGGGRGGRGARHRTRKAQLQKGQGVFLLLRCGLASGAQAPPHRRLDEVVDHPGDRNRAGYDQRQCQQAGHAKTGQQIRGDYADPLTEKNVEPE